MKLPTLPFIQKNDHPEYFLILLLRDEKVSAVIIEEHNGKVKIIGKHEEYFPTSLEDAKEEEWLQVLDKTISQAEDRLPSSIQTEKTVFGVKENWVTEKRIKKEYLGKLKKVCDTLELSPIGFLVISEAIANLVQAEEGIPVSAVIAEVGKRAITLSLFKGGQLLETKTGPLHQSIPHAVDSLLHHFTSVEVLPSRVILFSSNQGDDLSQEFIAHHWSRGIPFLHMPQISVLPAGFDAKSVVFGAAEQLGFEVIGPIVDRTGHEIRTMAATETSNFASQETHSAHETLAEATVEGDNFGFVQDEDIALSHAAHPTASFPHHSPRDEEDTFEHAPFSTEEDTSHSGGPKTLPPAVTSMLHTLKQLLTPLQKGMPALLSKIGNPSAVTSLFSGNKAFLAVPIVGLLIVLFALFYLFALKATVTLNIKSKGIDDNRDITFGIDQDNNFADNMIAAKRISTTIDGSVSTKATGKKDVGDKAKGTVTLYNSDTEKQDLAAGTTLSTSDGKKFTLDKDISIASASGDIFSGTKPGTAQVSVTASAIGPEYNMPSGTKFTVGSSSTLAGKNDTAFSGGSKKQVTVVAKADTDKLTAQLPQELSDNAKSDLQKKVASGEHLLPDFTSTQIAKKSFSNDIGEEASTVTLKGSVVFEAATYKDDDIKTYANTVIKTTGTQNLTLSDKGVKTSIENSQKKDDTTYSASLIIQAALLPELDTKSLAGQIKGKSFTDAQEVLLKQPQVESVDITLHPNLPLLPHVLPQKGSNITVTTRYE